jgi:hypothetical protein
MAHMDLIKIFTPYPFLQHIVNLQNTVWGYSSGRWWKKVDASSGSYAVSAIRLRNKEEYLPLGNMSATSLSLVSEFIFVMTLGIWLSTYITQMPLPFRCQGCAVRLVSETAHDAFHDQ